MEAFRTLIRGWLGKVLLVLFLAPLALVGIEGYFSGPNEAVAVEVNGQDITKKELDDWTKSQRDQYLKSVNGDETLLNPKVIEQEVYEAAIVRAVLLQQAKALGIQLSDEQLGTLIRQQSAFQQNGQFSQAAFEQYMAGTGTNMGQLLADFRQQTALNLITGSIVNTAIYGKNNTEKLIKLLAQERTTHLAEIPLNEFAKDFVATDAQLKAYYDKHQKEFMRDENVDVSYVVLSKAMFADQVQITEQDIEKQYQAYSANLSKDAIRQVSHILVDSTVHNADEAKKIADSIYTKFKAGEKFEALVQQYSEDPLSKEQQGKLEGYTLGAFGESFDKAVMALQVGQVSAPVKTDAGYHLIRVDAIDAEKVPALAEVRDNLVAELKKTRAENAYQDAINNATELALETDSLDALAQQFKLQVLNAKNVAQNTNVAGLSDPNVKVKLFSDEVRQGDRNVSTAVNLKSGDTLWYKVEEHRTARVQTFAEAKAQLHAKLKYDEQVKQAKASIKPLLDNLASKPAAQALMGQSLNFTNLGPVPRQSGLLPIEVEQAIYSVPAPKAGYWSAQAVAVGNSLVVVGVAEIGQNPAFNLTDEQKQQVVNRFDARGPQELNDYIEYLKANAKIEKNDNSKSANQ